MSLDEMKKLAPGDIIQARPAWPGGPPPEAPTAINFVVTGNYGDHVTAVHSVEVQDPLKWVLVHKARRR